MRVWRAAPEEAPVVAALLGGFRDHLGYDAPDDASLEASVERIIARDDAEYLLAGADEAVGVAQVRYRWSVWWATEDCWLEDLYVRDEARGSGVGRLLTEEVLRRAAERGCARVELDVNTENPPALALYRSLGFQTGKTGGQDFLMRRRL